MLEAVEDLVQVAAGVEEASRVEDGCRSREHGHVDEPGDAHRDHDVDPLEMKDLAPSLGVGPDDSFLCQRRVEVDDVGHHGGAEDAGGEEDRLRTVELRHEGPGRDRAPVWLGAQDFQAEGDDDHPDEHRDRRLEAAKTEGLQSENAECSHAREQRCGEERDAEDQVQAQRRADELGEVGGHRDQLRLDPEEEDDGARKAVPADLGQVAPGRDAELGAHGLDEHRHEVRGEDDPQEHVAELGAACHVGGEVAGVDVGDRGDECGAKERQHGAEAAALPVQRPLGGAKDSQLARKRLLSPDDHGLADHSLDQLGH